MRIWAGSSYRSSCRSMAMFEETEDATTLALIGTEQLKNGTAVLSYRVARP